MCKVFEITKVDLQRIFNPLDESSEYRSYFKSVEIFLRERKDNRQVKSFFIIYDQEDTQDKKCLTLNQLKNEF